MNEGPYRTAALIAPGDASPIDLPALRMSCPICGHDVRRYVCQAGHVSRSSHRKIICGVPSCMEHVILGPAGRFCSPERRIRRGFLWLRRCRGPAIHLHQDCLACGAVWLALGPAATG